jgi:hypothetical protein
VRVVAERRQQQGRALGRTAARALATPNAPPRKMAAASLTAMPLLAISTLRTGLWPPSARTYAATLAKRGAALSAAADAADGAPAASAEAIARERGGALGINDWRRWDNGRTSSVHTNAHTRLLGETRTMPQAGREHKNTLAPPSRL